MGFKISAVRIVAAAMVASAVLLGGRQALGTQHGGRAEMWKVFAGDGLPEHVYLRIPEGFTGRDGKPIVDKKTGKIITTCGFYFHAESNHGNLPMTGKIVAPDPMAGQGTELVKVSSDPVFDQMLSDEVIISQKHVPVYTWGDRTHKQYVCWVWAKDMWDRALQTVCTPI